MRRIVTILLCISLTAAFTLMPVRAVTSWATSGSKTIKVAVLNDSAYAYKDKKGQWHGMDVECMISIAQKTGMSIEFVDSSTDPDFMGNLNKGKYDIVADVVQTPERSNSYLFTDESIGTMNSTLAVRASDNRWNYGNIEQISRMKIGVLSSYANNEDFRSWCKKHKVTPEIVGYSDIGKMTSALEKGRIDGELYSFTLGEEYTKKFHTIMKLLPEPYYFAFRKSDTSLKNKVDEGLAQILSGNVNYLNNLKNKYETQFKSNDLPFSSTEKKYIKSHPTLNVGVVKGDAPYYKKSGKGIIPDYYNKLAGYSGLKFKYKTYDTQKELIKALKAKKIDIAGLYSDGIITAYGKNLALTDSFDTVDNVVLTKQGRDLSKVKTVAVKKSFMNSASEYVDKVFSDVKMVSYDSAGDCFDAMNSGDTDALILGMPSTTWLMNQHNSNSYTVVPMSNVTTDLCSALRADDQILCSILNKSIAATSSSFNGIVTEDTLPQKDWKSTISRIPPGITVAVVLVLLLLVLILIWVMIMLRKRQKEHRAVLAEQAEARMQKLQTEESRKRVEEKNAFLSNISHDMRTPLNAIIGFTNMARKNDITDEQRDDYLSKVESSGALMLELIDDTLMISKASSGKLEITPEPGKIDSIMKEIIVPIVGIAKKKNISVALDMSGYRSRTVLVDKLNVKKVLLNILNNAVKYTPENGHVWVTLKDVEDRELDTEVEIRDDGIGMDKEYLSHIFEPFSQEKRKGYDNIGTGLGLSIVKQLVDLMGGEISVQSEKNKGSVFTVRLHFQETGDVEEPSVKPDNYDLADLKGRKVLLCEDNRLNQEIAVALLNEKGIIVDSADDGRQGIDMFAKSRPGEYDAIIMDIRMTNIGGLEATDIIRKMDRPDGACVPIIAMSADAFEDDVRKCLAAGMNAHVSKPIDPDKLYYALASVMTKDNRE